MDVETIVKKSDEGLMDSRPGRLILRGNIVLFNLHTTVELISMYTSKEEFDEMTGGVDDGT